MTVDFFYDLDHLVRELPDTALNEIGQQLTGTMPGRDWRTMGAELNYTMAQMDVFAPLRTPGYQLLRDWSTREHTTIRVLRSKLILIGRYDLVTMLDDFRQNPMNLDVVIHDRGSPFYTGSGYSLTPEIRGRKELWDGLLPCLKTYVSSATCPRRYMFFNLRGFSWQNQCCDYRGQQVDIDVRRQDTTPAGSPPGFDVRQVAPSWHLMSPTQLRYTRTDDAPQNGRASSDDAKVSSGGTKFNPKTKTTWSGSQEPGAGWESRKSNNPLTRVTQHPTQESAAYVDPKSSQKSTNHVYFSCMKEANGCLNENKGSLTRESLTLALETSKQSSAIEPMKESLNLDLRSMEDPSDPRELPQDETTRQTAQVHDLDLCNTDRSSGLQETDKEPRSKLSTICLRSEGTSPDNQRPGIRGQEGFSALMVAMAPSSSAGGPGEGAEQELVELRENDPLLENEDSVSEGRAVEDLLEQQPHRLRRRHVYFLPKLETILNQFPGLSDLPGFHPRLKHKSSLIREVMKPFDKADGWYLIRVFVSDENLAKVHLALTVTYKGKLKHFEILRYPDSNPRHYFLFSRDYEASSISDLIDHYKIHPLVPGSLSVSGTNLPKLINPVPSDSFNY